MGSTSVRARPARLDPVGRLRLPRRTTTLRLALVAVLLLTAAGLLYSGGGREAGSPAGPVTGRPTTTVAAGPPDDDAVRQPIPDGMVGVPVPLAEPAALAVLHPGDRVDLLSVPAAGGEPVPVAGDAAVLAVDRAGGSVLLALSEEQARSALSASADARFAVVVRP